MKSNAMLPPLHPAAAAAAALKLSFQDSIFKLNCEFSEKEKGKRRRNGEYESENGSRMRE